MLVTSFIWVAVHIIMSFWRHHWTPAKNLEWHGRVCTCDIWHKCSIWTDCYKPICKQILVLPSLHSPGFLSHSTLFLLSVMEMVKNSCFLPSLNEGSNRPLQCILLMGCCCTCPLSRLTHFLCLSSPSSCNQRSNRRFSRWRNWIRGWRALWMWTGDMKGNTEA